MNNARIGTALLGGYVLGRTRKAKLALGLGALLAGSRIRPGQVGKALKESPVVHDLTDQVRSELTGAGKAAAASALTAKADSLADALHERTAVLRKGARSADDDADDDYDAEYDYDYDDYDEEVDEDREPDDRYDDTDEESRPTRRRRG